MSTTQTDFTPTGLKIEGQWENDRNAEGRDLFKAIIREVYGAKDVIIAHHFAYVAQEERMEDGHQFHYEMVEEIPSADTLIFDHDAARKLWGEDQYLNALARLAMEPPSTRDALLGAMYSRRKQWPVVPSEHSTPKQLGDRLLPCGMADRKLAADGRGLDPVRRNDNV